MTGREWTDSSLIPVRVEVLLSHFLSAQAHLSTFKMSNTFLD